MKPAVRRFSSQCAVPIVLCAAFPEDLAPDETTKFGPPCVSGGIRRRQFVQVLSGRFVHDPVRTLMICHGIKLIGVFECVCDELALAMIQACLAFQFRVTTAAPEPAAATLLVMGIAGIAVCRFWRGKFATRPFAVTCANSSPSDAVRVQPLRGCFCRQAATVRLRARSIDRDG